MPQPKDPRINNRKSSQIPIIIENKENDSMSTNNKVSTKKINTNQQKTIITGVSRRSSTIEHDTNEQTRSAPPSPALYHHGKQRSSHTPTSTDTPDNNAKSALNDSLLLTNGSIDSLSWGTLEVRLKYDAKNSRMWVFVIKATLEMTQDTLKQTLVQVHLTLLPNKRTRLRTRIKPINNAMFAEEFFCKVSPETIQTQGIRFRLYTYERFRREKLLAEATVMFAMVNLDEDMCKIIPLKRAYPSQDSDIGSRSNASGTCPSPNSSVFRTCGEGSVNSLLPELEIGLAYDRTHSMLILEIGKGINFGLSTLTHPPDTCVQIILRNSTGEEITTNQTVTRHAQYHPIYAERYPFNIQGNFLEQITFVISVINKKCLSIADHDFGYISFGHEASSPTQISHWEAMLSAHGETITRWHTLLEK
ncbi:unnamed protein product [Adineta steineri]|uniref:C2 domain-containing protein n=1 Tax=Adineta steineri TaxID=433720 RepID=A0A813SUD6_9BILA|nr:unnamed protein product [Adineta steineri]CAF1174019.1 unnamed protein product [Adineta steineri]